MSYSTLASLIERFGENLLIRLTDDTQTAIDETKVARAIAAVDGKIDSFLRQVYTLPLPEVPDELADAALDMVIARIYADKPEREVPKDVKDRAREALDWLEKIKKGLATLSVATLPVAPGTNGETGKGFFKTSKTKRDRIFDDERLDSFTGRPHGRR